MPRVIAHTSRGSLAWTWRVSLAHPAAPSSESYCGWWKQKLSDSSRRTNSCKGGHPRAASGGGGSNRATAARWIRRRSEFCGETLHQLGRVGSALCTPRGPISSRSCVLQVSVCGSFRGAEVRQVEQQEVSKVKRSLESTQSQATDLLHERLDSLGVVPLVALGLEHDALGGDLAEVEVRRQVGQRVLKRGRGACSCPPPLCSG